MSLKSNDVKNLLYDGKLRTSKRKLIDTKLIWPIANGQHNFFNEPKSLSYEREKFLFQLNNYFKSELRSVEYVSLELQTITFH